MHFLYGGEAMKGVIVARNRIDGLIVNTFKLSQNIDPQLSFPSPLTLAYPTGKVPIKSQKLNDIRALLPYVPQEFMEFYEELLLWPTAAAESDAEEGEII